MMSTDVGCVFTFWVDEENMDGAERAMADIFAAMEQEEFPTGDVRTYTAHRVIDAPGTYIMYEYFTSAGSERHSAGPLMQLAGDKLTSLMVKPYDRVVMQPFHAVGIGEPVAQYRDPDFKPSASDIAVVFTLQVHPQDSEKAEVAIADIFAAMEREEFPSGDVKTYTAHRLDTRGRFVMYEYFTAAGSKRHASGPLMREAGRKLSALFLTPYVRLMMEPVLAVGVGEPIRAAEG
jgi:quinol monooxygenase YgiN